MIFTTAVASKVTAIVPGSTEPANFPRKQENTLLAHFSHHSHQRHRFRLEPSGRYLWSAQKELPYQVSFVTMCY
jgi:hypothetical protein